MAHHASSPSTSPTSAVKTTAAAFPRTPSLNFKSIATTSLYRTKKCATVTMMLAERIIRNDWSVEDEHFFESNNMNVWQTLEFLSGLNSRKRYNYEGYNDANNAIRTLTASWRRDSFVEKNVNPNGDESKTGANGKYSTVATSTLECTDNLVTNAGGVNGNGLPSSCANRVGGPGHNRRSSVCRGKSSKFAKSRQRKQRAKQNFQVNELDSEYALSPSDYSDLIKCT